MADLPLVFGWDLRRLFALFEGDLLFSFGFLLGTKLFDGQVLVSILVDLFGHAATLLATHSSSIHLFL